VTPAFVLATCSYLIIIGIAATVAAVRRSGRPRWLRAGAWMLQVLLVVEAVIAAVTIVRGGGPARPALFLAYLTVAVALLPLCGAMTTSDRISVRSDAGLAIAAGVGLVVQWRLVATWRGAHA
jgi:hypothetical protein